MKAKFAVAGRLDIADAAGRRISCAKSGSAFVSADTLAYLYNARSELTNATATSDAAYRYGYAFDDIGNREAASERVTHAAYTANALNQYTSVGRGVPTAPLNGDDFIPQYDADGNETLVKTATGIWSVTYNAENRPILWSLGTNSITMSYDRMGRRVKKNDQRFVYYGYLQIADNGGNVYIWDPTEPVATRPLAWNRVGSTAYYFHDGNKNVSDVATADVSIAARYEYAPFGALTATYCASASSNSWRFSSEYADRDAATVYYNYRHYESMMGRWMQRDLLEEWVRTKNVRCFYHGNHGKAPSLDVETARMRPSDHTLTISPNSQTVEFEVDKMWLWERSRFFTALSVPREDAFPCLPWL